MKVGGLCPHVRLIAVYEVVVLSCPFAINISTIFAHLIPSSLLIKMRTQVYTVVVSSIWLGHSLIWFVNSL